MWLEGDPLAAAWSFDPRVHEEEAAGASASWDPKLEEEAAAAVGGREEGLITDVLAKWLKEVRRRLEGEQEGGGLGGAGAEVEAGQRLRGFVESCLRLAQLTLTWLQTRARVAEWARPDPAVALGALASAAEYAGSRELPEGEEFAAPVLVALPPPVPPLPASGAPARRDLGVTQLLRLQRIIRLGNLDASSSQGGGGASGGGRSSGGGAAAAAVASAVEAGLVRRGGCSVSGARRPLMAVCRGKWVGLMDLTDHLAEVTRGASGQVKGRLGCTI